MSRVVIIGAGVIGLLCGYELRKRGAEVAILDKGEPGRACSSGNVGWIVPSFSMPLPAPGLTWTSLGWMLRRDSPLHIDPRALPRLAGWLWNFWRHCNERDYRAGLAALASLNHRTMALYDALAADGVEFEMHRSGLLFVFRGEPAMRRAHDDFKPLEPYGYPLPQPLTGDELCELEPLLAREVVAGFWVEQERDLRPETLTAGLVKRLAGMGVEVRPGIEITGCVHQDGSLKAVSTSQGLIEGEHFLIAAGAWSGMLAKKLGFYLPIQAGKGYSLIIENPAPQICRPLYLGEAKVGCTPFTGALRVAGTMELSDLRDGVQPERGQAMCRAVSRYLRECPFGKSQNLWTCPYVVFFSL